MLAVSLRRYIYGTCMFTCHYYIVCCCYTTSNMPPTRVLLALICLNQSYIDGGTETLGRNERIGLAVSHYFMGGVLQVF